MITTRIERVSKKGLYTDNSLQKSIAFTPLAPKAGPTGGDGVAFPAGTKIFYSIQKRTVELESVDVWRHIAERDSISTYYDLCYCYFRHGDGEAEDCSLGNAAGCLTVSNTNLS